MDSRTFTVQQICQDRRQYRVPFYQRAYVWNREDQWGRLWEDIRDKAEARLSGTKAIPHFMGAVVLEPQKKMGLLGVERFHIIDGQQRLTTLQYVLTAIGHVLREVDQQALLTVIEGCLVNSNPETMEDRNVERFKLWPTFRDRAQYVSAMTATTLDQLRERFPDSFTRAGWLKKIGISHPPALEAIFFFRENMLGWLNEQVEGDATSRAVALASAVLTDLSIVCISLGEDDDAQVIFETLNGHGAELHATDLIRNFIFMRAGTDADELYANLWSQFEATLWTEKQNRGRLNRPRIEWFVQSAVQAELGDEIDIGRLYAGYRRFVDGPAALRSASEQLQFLNRYARHYKELVTHVGHTPIASFGRRIEAWEATSTHPLALHVAASKLDEVGKQQIFDSIESYLVRRAVCGLSRKNYNKVFAQLLRKIVETGIDPYAFQDLLADLGGEASRWPRDEEFRHHWLEAPVFPGRLDAPKLRSMFHRLEIAMRSEKSEERVPLSLESLDIDHILPQSWATHWPLEDGSNATESEISTIDLLQFTGAELDEHMSSIQNREIHVPRFGNLSLVHYGVNRSVQNYEFDTKRKAIFEHSNLHLNRSLMQLAKWDETSIQKRGAQLFEFAVEIWKGPA